MYPRTFTARERELLMWVLPVDRGGYAELRKRIDTMQVIAEGRRGAGHLILGNPGQVADMDSPLPSVVAFGSFEGVDGQGSVTVRDEANGQIEVEIVDTGVVAAARSWTYSTWTPGRPCPQCVGNVREVGISTASGSRVALAICRNDRRLWVYIERTGVCRPVPVTLFYSELMRRTGVRDPKLALRSERLFEALSTFRDDDLAVAFVSYNHVRAKVSDDDPLRPPAPRRSLFQRLFSSSRG